MIRRLKTGRTAEATAEQQMQVRKTVEGILTDIGARGGGSVIITSSIAGVRGNKAIGLYGLLRRNRSIGRMAQLCGSMISNVDVADA